MPEAQTPRDLLATWEHLGQRRQEVARQLADALFLEGSAVQPLTPDSRVFNRGVRPLGPVVADNPPSLGALYGPEVGDLLELAWGIIANAWEGNWDQAPAEWLAAAQRWRDRYHAGLDGRG